MTIEMINICLEQYRLMLRIRKFEERVIRLVNENEIAGVTHEYIGQEAVAAGICTSLRKDDIITSTHRGHGHIIAKGGQTNRMMAELFGRESGYNRGRGGSMHIADMSLGIYGANGIVAAGVPIAMGAAWTAEVTGNGTVAVSFFGDGAMNQGVLHESMNMASAWKLPIIFVCENNGYAVTFTSDEASANPKFTERAAVNNMPAVELDGMNVEAVYSASCEAVERARNGNGPTFLECRTYRYMGHHTAEATMNLSYRTTAEIEEWKRKDPIPRLASRLQEMGVKESQLDAIASEMVQELEDAVEYARQSPQPKPEDSLTLMYATPYNQIPSRGWLA